MEFEVCSLFEQASVGAVVLTDITFWCLLVPLADPGFLRLNPVSILFLNDILA